VPLPIRAIELLGQAEAAGRDARVFSISKRGQTALQHGVSDDAVAQSGGGTHRCRCTAGRRQQLQGPCWQWSASMIRALRPIPSEVTTGWRHRTQHLGLVRV